MVRHRLLAELEEFDAGREPRDVIRDPAKKVALPLPRVRRTLTKQGLLMAQILANSVTRRAVLSYARQAGQPEWVREQFFEAMGTDAIEHGGPMTRGKAYRDERKSRHAE